MIRPLAALLVFTLALTAVPPAGVQAAETTISWSAAGLDWYRWDPLVATVGRDETFTFTVKTDGTHSTPEFKLRSGQAVPFTSSDGRTFVARLTSAQVLNAYSPTFPFGSYVGDVTYHRGTEKMLTAQYMNVLPESVPTVAVTPLASDAQASPRVFNVWDPAWEVTRNGVGVIDVAQYAKRLYTYFGDDFDQLNVLIYPNNHGYRFHAPLKNSVQGIGKSIVDSSATFGSAGRLLGYNWFPISTSYDVADMAWSHEFSHQWQSYLKHPQLKAGQPHWPKSSVGKGILGEGAQAGGGDFPYDLIDRGGGKYELRKLTQCTAWMEASCYVPSFGDLDLYLMGLLDASQVQPIVVLKDQAITPSGGLVVDGVVVTIDDIIATDGPRIPSAASSPKEFRVGTLIVSQHRLLSPAEMDYFDHMTARGELDQPVATMPFSSAIVMSEPFAVATRGLGTVVTTMQPKVATSPAATRTPRPTATPTPTPTPRPTPTPTPHPTPTPTAAPTRTPALTAAPTTGPDVERRIAEFWKRVDALGPSDLLTAADLGQWALNVIERDPGAGISVADFRASTAAMQDAFDRAGVGIPPGTPKSPDIEDRIARFWQKVDALGPSDLLTAADLGQWALNVTDRDPNKRIRVDDFRASTAGMQGGLDRGRSLPRPATPTPRSASAATSLA